MPVIAKKYLGWALIRPQASHLELVAEWGVFFLHTAGMHPKDAQFLGLFPGIFSSSIVKYPSVRFS